MNRAFLSAIFLVLIAFNGCQVRHDPRGSINKASLPARSTQQPLPPNASPQLKQLIESAIDQTRITTGYDPAYVRIQYPGGDVPQETGVCSDVLVRAFRKASVDLQKQVHEDMKAAWPRYPRKWGAPRPDTNIDHRRVLNLMTFFERKGKAVPTTMNREDYLPGDLVAWDLGGGVDHIGIVSNLVSDSSKHLLIIHNIGAGTRAEDVLLNWKLTGHYRYF